MTILTILICLWGLVMAATFIEYHKFKKIEKEKNNKRH